VARTGRYARGRLRVLGRSLALLALLASPAAARAETVTYRTPRAQGCDAPAALSADARLACYAPAWVIEAAERSYNRIGTPTLRRAWTGGLRLRVDPGSPAVFAEVREDRLAGRAVQQLIYRVHFEKVPLRFAPSFFEAHRNPGLIAIVTVDAQSGTPLLLTAVHTCGCYIAVIPTTNLDASWLPEDWPDEKQRIYGKRLPPMLPPPGANARVHLDVESAGHRVSDVHVRADSDESWREMPMLPMDRLRSMPVEGRDGESGSIFYQRGPLRGHVRGAWNAFEGLTLFGLVSLDPTVGMDKDFGDPEQTGTPFYTFLRFWMHDRSRLDRMDRLLRELGFRMP
jgi:hypothetical protein